MRKCIGRILVVSLILISIPINYVKAEPKQTTPIVWEDGGEAGKTQRTGGCVKSGESTNGGVFGGIDNEKPVIKGVKNKTIIIGSKVDLKKGITVFDGDDGNLTKKLKVDSSALNTKKTGKYKIVYDATDKAGNKATKTCVVTVKSKPVAK